MRGRSTGRTASCAVQIRRPLRSYRVVAFTMPSSQSWAAAPFIVTLFQPGALQVVSFLHREQSDTWDLYMITRAAETSSAVVAGYRSAYLNRLEAMHRFLANVPTDRDPPIAPW
jgi:hypothetical protein